MYWTVFSWRLVGNLIFDIPSRIIFAASVPQCSHFKPEIGVKKGPLRSILEIAKNILQFTRNVILYLETMTL
ncbi:MAG: hypothetical protein ACP5OJ_00095 [Methanothermobacter sp.]